MICLYNYARHGNQYVQGQEYDIDADVAVEHEEYLGRHLWEGCGQEDHEGAPAGSGEGAPVGEQEESGDKPAATKKTKRSRSKRGK